MSSRTKLLGQLHKAVKKAIGSKEAWEWARSVDSDPFIAIEGIMSELDAIKPKRISHYLIIGAHTGEPIGCTHGETGKQDVLKEEPKATFRRVSKTHCPICGLKPVRNKQ